MKTDKEIIEAVNYCANNDDCEKCPAKSLCDSDAGGFVKKVADLINRQRTNSMTEKILNLVKRGYTVQITPSDVPDEIFIKLSFKDKWFVATINLLNIKPEYIDERIDYYLLNGFRSIEAMIHEEGD